MAINFNWRCPHCDHKVTITDERFSSNKHLLHHDNSVGKIALRSIFMVCPNEECKKPTLEVAIHEWGYVQGTAAVKLQFPPIDERTLMPRSDSRAFPEYVPESIRSDYEEACLIRELSPKSAATLARRALQGILRDFYKAKPGRLVDEIKALEDRMEPELLEAIHGVRKVGNIGAHMEADINLIVEVDPTEAQLLTELVETMIEESYVRREQRRNRLQKVAELSKTKEQARKALPAPAGLGQVGALSDSKPVDNT
jgi:hypothetical protein